jgi:hypothetical protein
MRNHRLVDLRVRAVAANQLLFDDRRRFDHLVDRFAHSTIS